MKRNMIVAFSVSPEEMDRIDQKRPHVRITRAEFVRDIVLEKIKELEKNENRTSV